MSPEYHTLIKPQARTYEGRLAEVCTQLARSWCWGQEQLAALEAKEEEAVALRVELTSLRENYRTKVTEVRCGPLPCCSARPISVCQG